MTISEIVTISEIAASIAVVVTLIFLIIQMRQNAKMLTRSNARQTVADHNGALQSLLDKEISELFLRGNNKGLQTLSLEERYRFDLAYTIWLSSVEQAFADHREGVYPAEQLVPFQSVVPAFLATQGGNEWWSERCVWFSQQFRHEVEQLLANYSNEALNAGPPISKGPLEDKEPPS